MTNPTPPLPIYLDAHSTTPCDARVIEAMAPCFGAVFGNASSRAHAFGWAAEALVDRAREHVAELIGAGATEIIFTSGATESNNLAIKGALGPLLRAAAGDASPGNACSGSSSSRSRGVHAIASAIEHPAVLDPLRRLEREAGLRLTILPVGTDGFVDVAELEAALEPATALVSVMWANNEIGVVQPIAEIGALCKRRGVLFHCDAVQALPWLACDARAAGVDLMSISAHKMHGPKGVGALYVRRRDPRVALEAVTEGGGQERGLRPGTLNTPGIVGLGEAARLALAERPEADRRAAELRDRLLAVLLDALPGLRVNGGLEHRLPNNLNFSIEGVSSDELMAAMTDVAVSSGSACATESAEPSHVLKAIGLTDQRAHESIRIGLSRMTTEAEIDYAARRIIEIACRLRGAS